MPLPTSKALTAQAVYDRIAEVAQGVLSQSQMVRALSGKPILVNTLIGLHQVLRDARAYGLSVQGTAGLVEYAQAATGDAAYNILGAFASVLDTGAAVTDWIAANVPNDGAGGYVGFTLTNGDFQGAQLSADQAAPLGPLLDALSSAIA
jgi:hypothetical protein